jgi:hypothetical protein
MAKQEWLSLKRTALIEAVHTAVRRLLRTIKLVDWRIWALVLLSTPTTVLYAVDRRDLACWFGRDLSDVIGQLALAVIAAFLFYIAVDVLRRMREQGAMRPYVSRYIERLQGDVEAICREVARASGRDLPGDWKFAPEEVTDLFRRVAPNAQTNMVFLGGRRATLLEYMFDRVVRSRRSLAALLQFSVFLGGEALSLIAAIQDSSFFMELDAMQAIGARINNTDLSVLSGSICDHHLAVLRLCEWGEAAGLIE